MAVALLIVSITVQFAQGVATRSSSGHLQESRDSATFSCLRGLLSTLIAVVVAALMGGFADDFSVKALLFGLLGGVSLAICFYVGLIVYREGGAMMFVGVFSKVSIFVTVVYSWCFLGEAFRILSLIGVILIIGAAIVMCFYKGGRVRVNLKIILLCLLSGLADGVVALSQKLFAFYEPSGSAAVFNVWMFLFCALFMLPVVLVINKGKPNFGFLKRTWPHVIFLAGAVFGVSQIMTMLAVKVPATILFPVTTGVGIILSPFAGLIFKEKITLSAILGVLMAIGGVVCLYV